MAATWNLLRQPRFGPLLFCLLFAGACNRTSVSSVATTATAGSSSDVELFHDVTAETGINFTYQNGEESKRLAILETLGGGVGLLDYDGDGLLDVFVTGGGYFEGKSVQGHSSRLFKNLGRWRFRDVTREAGLDQPCFYTHGCAVADYDRDGWPDLLVTGYGRLALYHNEPDGKGGRRFVEVTQQAGLTDALWSTSAAWADLDGDGYPDLYVCHYVNWSFKNNPLCLGLDLVARDVCPPANFQALPHKLYRNNGNGTFTDVSQQAGLHVTDADKNFGKGLGVIALDANGDGRPDIYVANDTTGNFLYLNRTRTSTQGGSVISLQDVGATSGVARDDQGSANGSMGLAAADYDGSGKPSLWVTNYDNELPALYRWQATGERGDPLFAHSTNAAGIAVVGRSNVGWGTGFVDVENRGWEDLVFVNGHTNHFLKGNAPRQQRAFLLRNWRDGRFNDISSEAGNYFRSLHSGRGIALGDLDNDGRLDMVISHLNEPVVVLRNEAARENHWLGLELTGRGHRCIVGARLTLEVPGRRLTRFAVGGGSYLSANDARFVFGLGKETQAGRLTVHWPWGRSQHWDNLAVDRYWRLTED
jgi:hypothetical protein